MSISPSSVLHKPSVLIQCNYVYGIGHIVRVLELARGLRHHFNVCVLNGGESIWQYAVPPGISFVQLPAIYSIEESQALRPVDGDMTLVQCFELRKRIIQRVAKEWAADLLVTEHFPFGPLFEDESLALIDLTRKCNRRAKVISSVRDIVFAHGGSERDTDSCSLLNTLYDSLLIHGDPKIVSFESSFSLVHRITVPYQHTGYIVKSIVPSKPPADLPILVASVGGGRMGGELLHAVLEAHGSIARKWQHRLEVFVGAFQKNTDELRALAGARKLRRVTIHEFDRETYLRTLAKSSVIVCMGGYNSLLEAVSTHRPVLVYDRPFLAGNQEQQVRIESFRQAGLVQVIRQEDLVEEIFANLVVDAVSNPPNPHPQIDLEGVHAACGILQRLVS